jgi:C1A family cysteine protease
MSELKRSKSERILNGWIPQEPDVRDRQYLQIARAKVAAPRSDLRPGCSPVENQEKLGSCVYNATIGALEFLEILNHEKFIDKSRLFAYYCGRADNGHVDEDTGDTIRHAMKILAHLGTCDEKLWPYDISKFRDMPTQQCYADAIQHIITSYYALHNIDEIRQCLTDGFPVCFGAYLFLQFELVGKDGIVKMPGCWKRPIGAHAMDFVGHNDDTEYLTTRNSWGTTWGDQGYCYIPYKYVEKYASDFWTVRVEK